jgi:hypothetical protein
MKEYDFDAAKRKFLATVLYFKDKLGILKAEYCSDIDVLADKSLIYMLTTGEVTSDPLYKPTPSGIYHSKEDPNTFTLVTRSPKKTFKIGFCHETHNISLITTAKLFDHVSANGVDLLKPLICDKNIIEKSLLSSGPINNKFWVQPGKIFYLRKQVGMRKGSLFLVNDTIKPFLEDALVDFNIKLV